MNWNSSRSIAIKIAGFLSRGRTDRVLAAYFFSRFFRDLLTTIGAGILGFQPSVDAGTTKLVSAGQLAHPQATLGRRAMANQTLSILLGLFLFALGLAVAAAAAAGCSGSAGLGICRGRRHGGSSVSLQTSGRR